MSCSHAGSQCCRCGIFNALCELLKVQGISSRRKECVMDQGFSFALQQVVESDMVCADGVCFIPPSNESTAQANTLAGPLRD